VKSIYDSRYGHMQTEKSPPLSQKLKALKKKSELEPHGVRGFFGGHINYFWAYT
jgi:hypothetical protein